MHHVHPDGRAPGRENLLEWGVDYHEFVAEGTSEDVAMLLAYEAGATLIVAVGTHATMVEFLDKGRQRHGVDVPHPPAARPDARRRQGSEPPLRRTRPAPRLVLLIGSALVVLVAVAATSDAVQTLLDGTAAHARATSGTPSPDSDPGA